MVDLDRLFELQAEINKRCGFDVDHVGKNNTFDGAWLNNFITATEAELAELRDCTHWKHWYKEAREGHRYELHDPEHAKVEVVDLLFMWISMAQSLGMPAREVEEIYVRKLAVNNLRQDMDCTTEEAKAFEVGTNGEDPFLYKGKR